MTTAVSHTFRGPGIRALATIVLGTLCILALAWRAAGARR